MVEATLAPRSPLQGVLQPGRHGAKTIAAGVTLAQRQGLQIVSLAARRGQQAALAAATRQAFGLDLPQTPRHIGDTQIRFLWCGPQQWLALAEAWPGDLEADLRDRLGTFATLADQSEGRVVLRLSGPATRAMLAKLMTLDLHPRAFATGDTALTLLALIGVQIWQVDDTPRYDIAAARGYARSLLTALLAAGAEYGIDVTA